MQKDGQPATHTATAMRAFTPAYAAPEQYSPKFGITSARTDVYSLALVAVEMLTDRNPLGVDDPPMMMHATLDPSSRPTPTRAVLAVRRVSIIRPMVNPRPCLGSVHTLNSQASAGS